MEEKKLTDEEIVKVLEIFAKDNERDGDTFLARNTLDLIHRLQNENATLKTELRKECEEHEEFTMKVKAEIERLKARCEVAEGTKNRLTIFDRIKIHDKAVKDTAKKFADLVEFHSIARMNDGVEYFTISVLGLKEILVEEFGFKYSELNGVEVE